MSTETANPPVAPAQVTPAPAAAPKAAPQMPAPANKGYTGGGVPDSVRAMMKPETEFIELPPPKRAAPAATKIEIDEARELPAPKQSAVGPDEDASETPAFVAKFLPKKSAAPEEPAPAAAPVASGDPEDLIEFPEGKAPRSEQWKQLKGITKSERAARAAAEERARSLEAQLQAAKTPAPDATEVETLRKQAKEMSDRLMLVDLQAHPKFKEQFVEPRNQALHEASQLLKANGIEGVNVAELLGKPRAEFGKAVSEAAAKLNDFDKVDFAEHMRKALNLDQGSRQALEKSRETYQALSSNDQGRQRTAFAQTWDKTVGRLAEHNVELEVPATASSDERSAIEAYNASFKGLRSQAEKIALSPMAVEEVSTAAIKAAAYDHHINHVVPMLGKHLQGLMDNNRALASQLTAIRAKNPNRDQKHVPAGGDHGPDPSKMTHEQAAEYYSTKG